MTGKKTDNVTMRVRLGESEMEVTGPSDFVERKIAEFVERQGHRGVRSPSGQANPVASTRDGANAQPAGKVMSVAQFFKTLALKSDVDRVLAGGYYLEKNRSVDKLTTAEVRDTIREARVPPPKNPSECIAMNIKKGRIMGSGDKDGTPAYVLTTDGEEAVGAMRSA
jgi:hypothetical protein